MNTLKKSFIYLSAFLVFSAQSLCADSSVERSRTTSPYLSILSGGSGLNIYNTTDLTTNYEKFTVGYQSNTLYAFTAHGGSGSARAMIIGGSGTADATTPSTNLKIAPGAGEPFFTFTRYSTITAYPFISLGGLTLAATSSSQTALSVSPTINQSSTAGYIALDVNPTETATGSGSKILQRWAVGNTSKSYVDNTGHFFFDATNTAGGSTGNKTINKPSGTVNFAAAATAITVTNSTVTTSSIVTAIARTNDSTCSVKNVVPGSGSFVINMTAACTAETSVGFVVFN